MCSIRNGMRGERKGARCSQVSEVTIGGASFQCAMEVASDVCFKAAVLNSSTLVINSPSEYKRNSISSEFSTHRAIICTALNTNENISCEYTVAANRNFSINGMVVLRR